MTVTELLRQSSGGWELHIQRFFAASYQPYDRQKAVSNSAAERIISVDSKGTSADVITTGSTGGRWRFRYEIPIVITPGGE